MDELVDVLIIGSGPAAYTAAIYAARAQLSVVVITGLLKGGQLMTTTEVENFPGFPQGIGGGELMEKMEEQAKRFGARIEIQEISSIEQKENIYFAHGEEVFRAKTVIVATGAAAKTPLEEIVGAKELWQQGISACAVCDGALPPYRNKNLFVIGGGDSACEEALYLTKYASHVYMVVRKDYLKASKIMAERAEKHPKITILFDSKVTKTIGDKEGLESVEIKNIKTGELTTHEGTGLFFAVGHTPNSSLVDKLGIKKNSQGYIETVKGSTKTNLPGLFAAGDVQDSIYRQAITAAGSGCMAALEAEKYLQEHFEG